MKERSGRCSDGHLSMHRDPSFTDVELAKLSHHTEHHPVDFDFASTVFFNTTAIESTSAAVAACAACLCSDAELAAAALRFIEGLLARLSLARTSRRGALAVTGIGAYLSARPAVARSLRRGSEPSVATCPGPPS